MQSCVCIVYFFYITSIRSFVPYATPRPLAFQFIAQSPINHSPLLYSSSS